MAVDLHTHSRYSDGSDSPADIVARATRIGLTAVALTDHDLLDGLPEAEAAATDIELVPGAELSVEWRGMGMHLLTYWVPAESPLADRLAGIQRGRAARNREIVDVLVSMGIDITMEELEAEAGYGVIGRPHFAALLVEKGVVASITEAFEHYLAAGKPAYRPRERVGARESIELAWESGAVPVVAHPHTLADGAEDFSHLVPALAELGVGGIECYYVEYPQSTRDSLARVTLDAGLVATGGSDYHGTYKPSIELGSGKGDLAVPEECLERLIDARR